jgi:NNP family nitrate/nitrite transporter-like MFS transporter
MALDRPLPPLLARGPRNRALHLSWVAFFLCFAVWFDFAPFSATIGHRLHLTAAELTTVGLCNLGLTVPARFLIGMALDRFGPRRVFGAVLVAAAVPNTVFAAASSFDVLVASRLVLSIVGAGFVAGIRMVAEWWPGEEIGAAEGIYGGWGNLGGGAAIVGLPVVAGWLGGWRWAIGLTGLVAAAWGVVYLLAARDTADGRPWERPRRQGALQVTSRSAVIALALLCVPVTGVVGVIAYEVERAHVIGTGALAGILAVLGLAAVAQIAQVARVNRAVLRGGSGGRDPYPFRAVVLCCLSYMVTFGGELAVLSILPTFFARTWHLGVATAGAAAGTFGLMNLVTRPSGGIVSDLVSRRCRVLLVGLAGTAVGFLLMTTLGRGWPVGAAVVLAVAAAAALQFANGACFAIVPLIRRRSGGQVAGLAGAYGNIGGALLLFSDLYVHPQVVFGLIGVGAVAVGLLAAALLPEPGGARAAPTDEPALPALVRS